jgi:hypothetical protein
MNLIQPLLRGAPPASLALALCLCLGAAAPRAAAAAAPRTTVSLDWTEYAPLCNTVLTVGVNYCGPDPYPPVFRLQVGTLTVWPGHWSLTLALKNLTRSPLSFSGGFELCELPQLQTTRTDCMPASAALRPLAKLAGGATWQTTAQGRGAVLAHHWIRVLLPGVTGAFGSPTGGVISWLTVHAYWFGPGAHSIARYNGDGYG